MKFSKSWDNKLNVTMLPMKTKTYLKYLSNINILLSRFTQLLNWVLLFQDIYPYNITASKFFVTKLKKQFLRIIYYLKWVLPKTNSAITFRVMHLWLMQCQNKLNILFHALDKMQFSQKDNLVYTSFSLTRNLWHLSKIMTILYN